LLALLEKLDLTLHTLLFTSSVAISPLGHLILSVHCYLLTPAVFTHEFLQFVEIGPEFAAFKVGKSREKEGKEIRQ
jgi:hypothetical protein